MIEQRQRWLPEAIRATFEIYRQTGDRTWVAARGSSMRPLIAPGARLLVEFGAAPASVGEIVLFGHGDMVIAHRLVAWRPSQGGLVAKGDAEAFCDAPLDLEDILGVVRALRRGPSGPATRVGCVGRPARAVARASRWLGRSAALARRAATFLPAPLRRLALRAIPLVIRGVALALFAPIVWATQILVVSYHGDERR